MNKDELNPDHKTILNNLRLCRQVLGGTRELIKKQKLNDNLIVKAIIDVKQCENEIYVEEWDDII